MECLSFLFFFLFTGLKQDLDPELAPSKKRHLRYRSKICGGKGPKSKTSTQDIMDSHFYTTMVGPDLAKVQGQLQRP